MIVYERDPVFYLLSNEFGPEEEQNGESLVHQGGEEPHDSLSESLVH